MVFAERISANQGFHKVSRPSSCSNIWVSQEKPQATTSFDTCGTSHKEHYWNTAFKPYSVRPRETNL